jgi:acyl carrier protein
MTADGADRTVASHQGPLPPSGGEAGEFEAWLDHVSLTLTISHTRQELDAGLEALTQDRPLNDISRTYVHELGHSAQVLGTTLGYFTWMLRSAQSDYVLRMLRWLVQDAKRPVMMPLIRYLPTLDAYDDKATGLVHGWQITESLIAELAGTVEGFLHSGVQMPVEATTWPQRWKRLQSNITELYESPGNKLPNEFFMALWAEPVTPVPDHYIAQMHFLPAQRAFTIPAVMESAALALELSPADEEGMRRAIEDASGTRTAEEHELYELLVRTRRAYPDLPARSLLATHLAACDVALNPPCLPNHLLDRKGVNFKELHPVARTVEIWQKLGKDVTPARDIDDALRCADDICLALGWTTVSEVIQRAAGSFNDKATNPRGRAFAAAMKARIQYPPLTHNPWVPIWGNGPLADVYRIELTPAFWVFRDSWTTGRREPSDIDALLCDTLQMQWTRSMMLGRPATLQVPVELPKKAREMFSQLLAQRFSANVGKGINAPAVENPMPDMLDRGDPFDTPRPNPNTPAEIVKIIIAHELGIEETQVIQSARLKADLGADELDMMEIITALEEQFKISIADSDAINLTTVGQMITHVERGLAKRGQG